VVAPGDGGSVAAGGVGLAPGDGSIVAARTVAPAPADRGLVGAGGVAAAPTDRGLVAASVVVVAPGDGGVLATGLVAVAAADGRVLSAGGVGVAPTDGGVGRIIGGVGVVACEVKATTCDDAVVVRHLVPVLICSSPGDGRALHPARDAVEADAADDVRAFGVGFQAQGALVVHPQLQGVVVGRAQPVVTAIDAVALDLAPLVSRVGR